MFAVFLFSAYSATLRPSGKKDEVFEVIEVLSKQAWVNYQLGGTFKSQAELSAFLHKNLLPDQAQKILSRAQYSSNAKYHFVNFSASMAPNKMIRYFVRQNSLVKVTKYSDSRFSVSIVPVFGRITLNAYRRKYEVKKGWRAYEWLPLPAHVINDCYMGIQGVAEQTLGRALSGF